MFRCFEVSLILDHFYHFGSYGYSDYFEEGDMVVVLCYLMVGTRYKHELKLVQKLMEPGPNYI